MNTLVHADVFFFVTTIAIVVLGLLATVALIYIIKILHRGHEIMKEIKAEAVLVRHDLANVRTMAGQGTTAWKTALTGVKNFFERKAPKAKKKSA